MTKLKVLKNILQINFIIMSDTLLSLQNSEMDHLHQENLSTNQPNS